MCPAPYTLYQNSCFICPMSYTGFEDKCYKWNPHATSWQNARVTCQRDSGDLVSLDKHPFFEHIRQIVNASNIMLWVGASDLRHEGQWYWVNGAPVPAGTSGGWKKGEPNNAGNEDCAHLWPGTYNGYMNDYPCNQTLNFMCERTSKISHCFTQNRTWASPCQHGGKCNELFNGYNCTCTEQFTGFHCEKDLLARHDSTCKPGGSCYSVFTLKYTWNDAKKFCEARRGHLAVPDDLAEQLYLENYLRSMRARYSETVFWIGGKKTESYPPDWVTGYSAKFSRWPPGAANTVSGSQCLVLDGAYDFKWEANSCSRPTYFVCEERVPFKVSGIVG